jgi:hypothetical protein
MEQEGVHAVIGALVNIIAHGLRAHVRLVLPILPHSFFDTNGIIQNLQRPSL